MLEVGAGQAEITPLIGSPLSGFIARENKPSTGVDTPLYVRTLAFRDRGQTYFQLSYDLLGLGPTLEEHLLAALEQALGGLFIRDHCAITATHNHSGPPTGLLLGETPPDPHYLESLATQSIFTVRQALAALQPAQLYIAERRLPGLTYNRRALLSDGRVSIAPIPDLPVLGRGPLDDRLTVLLFRNPNGSNLAALAHYACHGVAVLSQRFGGDIPGALAAEIGAQLEVPCLFLQSAAGDVNPTTVTASRVALKGWVEAALPYLRNLKKSLRRMPETPLEIVSLAMNLEYADLPALAVLEKQTQDLARIVGGDVSSPDVQDALRAFKNTMNLPAETPIDPATSQFAAQALLQHANQVWEAARSGRPFPSLPLHICVWRIGSTVLVFLAGEIFTSTGQKIRALSNQCWILPVSYLAPLVGYIPDREALSLGGYEVNDAWRFYGQPAPFAVNSEERLVEVVAKLIGELSGPLEKSQ
jgi:neutral ceramidase